MMLSRDPEGFACCDKFLWLIAAMCDYIRSQNYMTYFRKQEKLGLLQSPFLENAMALPESLSPTSEDAQRRAARITPRSVALGLPDFLSGECMGDVFSHGCKYFCGQYYPSSGFYFAIFLCVFIVNTLLKIRFDKNGLASRELAVIFAMGLIGAIIPARGLTGIWLGLMAAPHYLATPENGWIDNVQPFFRRISFPLMITSKRRFCTRGCHLACPFRGRCGLVRFSGGLR